MKKSQLEKKKSEHCFLSTSIALLAFKVFVVVAVVVAVVVVLVMVVVAPNLLSFCSDNRSKQPLLQYSLR